MRARFDSDQPYLTHPRAAVIAYEPLAAAPLKALALIHRLMRRANADELQWLIGRETLILRGDCADCPPVRNVGQSHRNTHRSEMKYRNAKRGPRNVSGKARS